MIYQMLQRIQMEYSMFLMRPFYFNDWVTGCWWIVCFKNAVSVGTSKAKAVDTIVTQLAVIQGV